MRRASIQRKAVLMVRCLGRFPFSPRTRILLRTSPLRLYQNLPTSPSSFTAPYPTFILPFHQPSLELPNSLSRSFSSFTTYLNAYPSAHLCQHGYITFHQPNPFPTPPVRRGGGRREFWSMGMGWDRVTVNIAALIWAFVYSFCHPTGEGETKAGKQQSYASDSQGATKNKLRRLSYATSPSHPGSLHPAL